MSDAHYMNLALKLAKKGEGGVNPNPLVGAVVVKGDTIVGQGYHAKFGGPHAEVAALNDAGEDARGATLFVTLEPCCHRGKTPPCTERIIKSGVSRVVVAVRDPNPLVDGKGISIITSEGIDVTEGLLTKEAMRMNEVFFKFITTGLPFVQLKLALSLDGKIATRTGDSKWITSLAARKEAHRLRRKLSAVMVGVGTVIADDPHLTVRHVAGRNPLRVILDGGGRTPLGAAVITDEEPTIVATCEMSKEKEELVTKAGNKVWQQVDKTGALDLHALLSYLAEQQVDSILVEGGGEAASAFLKARLVDKISFFLAPIIIGGRAAVPAVGGDGCSLISEALRLRDTSAEWLGEDLLYTGYPIRD